MWLLKVICRSKLSVLQLRTLGDCGWPRAEYISSRWPHQAPHQMSMPEMIDTSNPKYSPRRQAPNLWGLGVTIVVLIAFFQVRECEDADSSVFGVGPRIIFGVGPRIMTFGLDGWLAAR